MHPDGGGHAEIELVDAPRPRRRRFGLLALNVSVIVAALVGIYVLARELTSPTPSRPTRPCHRRRPSSRPSKSC